MRPRKPDDSPTPFVHVALLTAVAIGAVFAGAEQADSGESEHFRAACVKVDITPEEPQWLQGYGPRQSTGVHDRIYHRIAILDDGTTTFCLVSTDICTISPLSIRANSPFAETFYFGLTNGSLLYLTTKAAFAEGGYEPNVSTFTDRAEADFTSAVTQYLRQLKK